MTKNKKCLSKKISLKFKRLNLVTYTNYKIMPHLKRE